MLDIILIACLVCLGYQLGKIVTILKIHNGIVDILTDNPTTESDTETKVFKLKVEHINSTLYMYDDENNFICQADSIDKLAKMSYQYNNINYASVMHDSQIYTFIKGVATIKV